ncbi:bone morphogenetic protein 10-like [Harmonia axyridis]|uniref:bone morphogenetic protein 10-like n=1 Tax=Harmonia axyridis TaxID=115357 RepID=UPI001E278AB7|nr:bone morphogenetic protein 10-like [Harmonia axyridis]
MKIVYLTIIFVLVIVVILLLLFSNDFVMVKNSNTSVRVNVMRAIYIENGKSNDSGGEHVTKTKKKIRCHISKFMLQLYENNKTGLNNSIADVVRSVVPKHADSFNDHAMLEDLAESHLLIFDLPETNKDEIFTYAELKILTLIDGKKDSTTGIEKKISLFVYDELKQEFINAHVLHVYHSNDTWLSFNLTDQVANVLNRTNTNPKNLKVIITLAPIVSIYIEEENKLKLSLLPRDKDNFDHDYPILILSYISKTNQKDQRMKIEKTNDVKRRKRYIEEDDEEESNSIWDELVSRKTYEKKLKRLRNLCRRKPLYVDFAEIRYDEWIVQPKGYEAFQCQGKCFYPVAEHLSPTKHAIVQALLHSVSPSRTSRSCCVPTSLDSISILYIDNKGVLTYRYAYKDMVVLECGCR